jgi:predicted ATPase/DNA-binding CsgD family transcriptional regulator
MATTRSTAAGRVALPAELTSFVGRRQELSEARRLLGSGRMLTLTGVGGVGKTRLALRMAAEVRRSFPDGVWFVELAALNDAQLLPHTVAQALGLRQMSADPAADLAAHLEDQQLLVVLDNCEHLTGACAVLVSKLLAAAPGLRVLAASRHVLGVEGEQILALPPLSVPDEGALAGDATHYESVKLFLDRALAVAPEFEITDGNRATVVELCRMLEGIPLAIELAAVWLRTLSPEQILERLEDRFRLLTGARPGAPAGRQTLEATVGWSFDLCSPAERVMWGRLSVFAGGFDLAAAEDVCSGDGIGRDDVLELVAGLVNKSIIVRRNATDNTNAWYEMLEIVRQFGAARLDADQPSILRTRHRDYYRALAQQFEAEGFGPDQAAWLTRVRREHGNIRAALQFCLESTDQTPAALDIAAPLWFFWFTGSRREGLQYLVRALELAPEPTPARATALWAAGYLAMVTGEPDRMDIMVAEAAELAERFDHDLLAARILECQGHARLYVGDFPTGIGLLEDARDGFRSLGVAAGEFNTLLLLALGTFLLDDPRDQDFSRQALELAERRGAMMSRAYALSSLGMARWRAGDHEGAVQVLLECTRYFRAHHDLIGISFGVQALSWCAASQSPDVRAARLLGASQAVWRASQGQGRPDRPPPYAGYARRSAATVRDAIGAAGFEQAFAEGASYTVEQAVALALGEDSGSGDPTATASRRHGAGWSGRLTRREVEIAGLLAEGLTNREIATRLVISPRTVEAHVDHILTKLGMTSRAQVASWVTEQQVPEQQGG